MPLSLHGIAFLGWMFCLEQGLQPATAGTWCGLGDGVVVSRGEVCLLLAAGPGARCGAEQQHSSHLEEAGHKLPTSTAQVEFPQGINLLEKQPGLDISYYF